MEGRSCVVRGRYRTIIQIRQVRKPFFLYPSPRVRTQNRMTQRTHIPYKHLTRRTEVLTLIRLALEEDLGERGDVTSVALLPGSHSSNTLVAREHGVIAGLPIAEEVFRQVDPEIHCETPVEDGTVVEAGTVLMKMSGNAGSLLAAERTVLNFLQRLSGVASTTRCYVDAVSEFGTMILDTRKTTPGWRLLEKYAVHCGGGTNHRAGLYDQILIKDNHLAHWSTHSGRTIADAITSARAAAPDLLVEVEADTMAQVKAFLPEKPDWILLDNMSLDELRTCAELCRGTCLTEASGGITMETLREVAATGVDAISVGALTHSVIALDIGMDAG